MGILGKITGRMVSPTKVKEKLADKQFEVGRNVLIKGLPAAIKLGCKEQTERGITPTVDSIFNSINADNLAFYHKMQVTDDYIKEVIRKVIGDK